MRVAKQKLVRLLKHRLPKVGLTYDALHDASEIVVFGSRAAGVSVRGSDIDVLLVGLARRINRCGLDVISVSSEYVATGEWLGSELASHIATYGIWLQGKGEWKKSTVHTSHSEIEKARRIERILSALISNWGELHSIFQSRYRRVVRRELQRLNLLRQGKVVPPSAVLDRRWRENRNCPEQLIELTRSLNIDPTCVDFLSGEVFGIKRSPSA
jgi:predicted nucleotidyltransferase